MESEGKFEFSTATVVQGAALAILIWVGATTLQTSQEVAVLNAKVEALREELRAGVSDRYTATDARRDQAASIARVQAHAEVAELRFESIERRLTAVEDGAEARKDG
jgi:hypothetical protein